MSYRVQPATVVPDLRPPAFPAAKSQAQSEIRPGRDLHGIYDHMRSLSYKIALSKDKVQRIRLVVAQDQFDAARHLPRSKGRGPRERTMAYWDQLWAQAEAADG